jgi:hypothetical protein
MSDLVEQLLAAAQEIAAAGHFGWGNRMQIAAARIEELERLRSAEAAEAARVQLAMNDEIEELERFVRKFADAGPREWLGLQEEARAVLEKGKQPSAAESIGEEIENVAIVTRTVKAGQGRVEGEP